MAQFANRVRKGVATHLHFEFMEKRYYDKGRYHRVRCIDGSFKMTPDLEEALGAWLRVPNWPNPEFIRLTDSQIDVVVRWKKQVHPLFRTFTTMPAVATHPEDNPIYKALRKKERQLSGAPDGTMKCIFLGDAGCRMLRELRPLGPVDVSGDQVIRHFMAKTNVDIVCVFSPYRDFPVFGGFNPPRWKVTLYDRHTPQTPSDYERLNQLASGLPPPRLEGYQARSWHRQGSFDPQGRGIYLGCRMTSKSGSLSISISARLVLELLAGRITPEQFQHFAFDKNPNQFDQNFKRGLTIQSARIEKAGPDKDDDFFVFDLEPDVSAHALAKPKTKA